MEQDNEKETKALQKQLDDFKAKADEQNKL
jgi:hypothetical protein